MAFTREQACAALTSLNPAPVFLDSYRVRPLPENLDIYFGPPEECFIASDTQELYTHNCLVPILDDGDFGLVTFLNLDIQELVQMDVESPTDSRVAFRHWQQHLADLMIRVGESADDDCRLQRMAELVGFAHMDELFDRLARMDALSGAAWCEARRSFPLSSRAKPGAVVGGGRNADS